MKNDKSLANKIEKLRREIQDHDYRYYVLAEPTISDPEYDKLMKELQDIENQHPEFITLDSPTQRVSGEPTKKFPTVTHEKPMLSLSNSYSGEDVREFDKRIQSLIPGQKYKYVCELKFDGIAVSLKYVDGVLNLGATRGDGYQGDAITNNLKTIHSVPLRIHPKDLSLLNMEVRGEVFMLKGEFTKFNDERELQGEKLFVNPRNAAAGTLKLQDSKKVAERPLNFFAYYLNCDKSKVTSHYDSLKILSNLKFPINAHNKLCNDIEGVIDFWKEWETRRDKLPYDIDGVVVKIDSLRQQELIGTIAKSPRWAFAFKFTPRKAQTKLIDIKLQVGRIGTITPVAHLQPVFLGGTTVSRASMYNEDYIREHDIRIGDTVVVEKGGDVIPKVTSVITENRSKKSGEFIFSAKCPECGSKIYKPEGEVNYYCENNECPAQIKGRITHWASRSAMDISGLGEMAVNQLVDSGIIRNVGDLYSLHLDRDKLSSLERWGEKSVQNLLDGIENSKQKPYHRVLFALGIRHVGGGIAQIIAAAYPSIDELISATQEDLQNTYEIGPKIADSVRRYFSDKHNCLLIKRLKDAGLKFTADKVTHTPFTGKTFVLSGTLSSMSREEAKEEIEKHGGRVASSVSKSIDCLIVGEEAGSKLNKAKKLNVDLWDEEKFLSILKKK